MSTYLKLLEEQFSVLLDTLNKYDLPFPDVQTVPNIFDAVAQDDHEYAQEHLGKKTVYGLLYPSKRGQIVIYILEGQDADNNAVTTYHELVHFFDYHLLAREKNNYSFRLLQEDVTFLMWTEFHATLLSYKFYFLLKKKETPNFDYFEFFRYLIKDYHKQICGKKQIDRHECADYMVRLFGKVIALQDEFEEKSYDMNISILFYNNTFREIYMYLSNNKEFNHFIKCKDDLEDLLLEI